MLSSGWKMTAKIAQALFRVNLRNRELVRPVSKRLGSLGDLRGSTYSAMQGTQRSFLYNYFSTRDMYRQIRRNKIRKARLDVQSFLEF